MGNTAAPSWHPQSGREGRKIQRRAGLKAAKTIRQLSRHPMLNDSALGAAARALVPGEWIVRPQSQE